MKNLLRFDNGDYAYENDFGFLLFVKDNQEILGDLYKQIGKLG